MTKKQLLEQLTAKMEADTTLPLISKPEDIIPGFGNPHAEIVFIGEAGGYHESIQRKPFVGMAGKLLDHMLEKCEVNREDVYITNMVKTRPPENRDPTPDELASYSEYLNQELDIIKPEVIVTLGRFSMGKFLPGVKISSVHGRHYPLSLRGFAVTIVPMYHPAAALRNSSIKSAMVDDFVKFKTMLKIRENTKPRGEQLNFLEGTQN